MLCPNCGQRGAEVYEGEAAHKLNTVMCQVCGRVPLPVPAPEPEPKRGWLPADDPDPAGDAGIPGVPVDEETDFAIGGAFPPVKSEPKPPAKVEPEAPVVHRKK